MTVDLVGVRKRHECDHHYPCECCRDAVQLADEVESLKENCVGYAKMITMLTDVEGSAKEITTLRAEIDRLQRQEVGDERG